MKAVLFLALVGHAAAATAFNVQYVTRTGGSATTVGLNQCQLNAGYVFVAPAGTTAGSTSGSCLLSAGGAFTTGASVAIGLKSLDATTCGIVPGGTSGSKNLFFLGCAPGYTATGANSAYTPAAGSAPWDATVCNPPPNTVPIFLTDAGTKVTPWTGVTAGVSVPAKPYDIDSDVTFKCTKPAAPTSGCNITCTGGAACATGQTDAVLSGSPLVASSLCAPGATVQTSTVNGTEATTCNAPTKNVDWLVTCAFGATPGPDGPSVENATTVTAANSAATAAVVANPTGVSAKVNSGVCAGACRERGNSGKPSRCEQAAVGDIAVSVGFAIQCSKCFNCFNGEGSNVTGLRQAAPGGLTITCTGTAAAQKACWEYAACNGLIAPGEPCIIDLLAQQCPECPSESKKGLLGLLGLLGLIPLLLCSLLLCCLLLACRRKKAERDVHFATFDAGVPNCSMPVVHNTASVYHQTHVGAPHVAGPVACY